MTTSSVSPEGKDALARAKRYLLARPETSFLDDLALKCAGLPEPEKRAHMKSAANDLEAELRRLGASTKFIGAALPIAQLLLLEKIAVAEAEVSSCPQ